MERTNETKKERSNPEKTRKASRGVVSIVSHPFASLQDSMGNGAVNRIIQPKPTGHQITASTSGNVLKRNQYVQLKETTCFEKATNLPTDKRDINSLKDTGEPLHAESPQHNGFVGIHIQAKLTVSESGDIYEQEADRVADTVMRMP